MATKRQFREWGRKGGESVTGEAKRRGGKEHYSRLGKKSAVKRKWRDKLPPEARPGLQLSDRCDGDVPGGTSLKGPPRRRRSASAR